MSGRIRILIGVAVLVVVGVGAWFYLTRGLESTDDAQVDAHVTPVAARVGVKANLLPGTNSEQRRTYVVFTRDERLSLIQRLCTHFAGVIDAHQPRGVILLFRVECSGSHFGARRNTLGMALTCKCLEDTVGREHRKIEQRFARHQPSARSCRPPRRCRCTW